MVRSSVAVEHRQQHEDDVQRKPLRMHQAEVGLVLRNDGDDLSVQAHRGKRLSDLIATGGVEDHVEAHAVGQSSDVVFHALVTVVDGFVGT